ncbi:hypothetical protein BJ508DRAFT_379793 [Ascobolus immersus RN42]|uniref:Uncharacterized protein n=1 Tax=Ascobolus immersus RN42 TaxID=1160509 RepID=A0A3N4HTQ5_ASCIM|nr:hypothetical protein BJ508DRAFT_379793 [Ascobolus immersus RN42]
MAKSEQHRKHSTPSSSHSNTKPSTSITKQQPAKPSQFSFDDLFKGSSDRRLETKRGERKKLEEKYARARKHRKQLMDTSEAESVDLSYLKMKCDLLESALWRCALNGVGSDDSLAVATEEQTNQASETNSSSSSDSYYPNSSSEEYSSSEDGEGIDSDSETLVNDGMGSSSRCRRCRSCENALIKLEDVNRMWREEVLEHPPTNV